MTPPDTNHQIHHANRGPQPLVTQAQAHGTDTALKNAARGDASLKGIAASYTARAFLAAHLPFGLDPGALAGEVNQFAAHIMAAPGDAANLDPLLLAELGQLLSPHLGPETALPRLVTRMADELAAQPAAIMSAPHARLIASRLRACGHAIAPAPAGEDMTKQTRHPERWLNLSADDLRAVLETLQADGAALPPDDADLLGMLAVAEFRQGRLDLGCLVLRTVLLAGLTTPEVQSGLWFMALQRRRTGLYGFRSPVGEADGAAEDHTSGDADSETDRDLLITMNALWVFHLAGWYGDPLQSARETYA